MVQRGDPTQGDPERSLEDRDDAVRGGMNRLPTLRARGAAAFEQAFARRMLRLRKTVELNATSCSNATAGPSSGCEKPPQARSISGKSAAGAASSKNWAGPDARSPPAASRSPYPPTGATAASETCPQPSISGPASSASRFQTPRTWRQSCWNCRRRWPMTGTALCERSRNDPPP